MDKKRPIIKYKRSFRNTGPKGSTGLKGLKTILPSTRKFYKPKPLSSNLSPKDYSDKIIEQQGDPLAAAVNFISGGSKPGASIVSGAKNNIVGFQRNNISPPSQNNLGSVINNISNTQSYGRATGYDILDFFGSKKTERKLRKSVQRLRNSLTETFEIAKFLRITINRIAKQLKDIPSISGGGGGGGGALGLIAGLIGGVVKLIGSVAGAVFSLFARIGLGGAAKSLLPKIALGGMGVLGVLGLGDTFMNKVQAQENELDIQRNTEKNTVEKQTKSADTFEKIINKFKQAVDLLLSGGKAKRTGDESVTPSDGLMGGERTTQSNAAGASASQKQVADVLTGEFKRQGLSEEGARLATAEIGRENSLNRDLILGTHMDNGVKAYGAVSWQGGREKVLMDELRARGIDPSEAGLKESGDEGIKANAAAMIKEIQSRGHTELLSLLQKQTLNDAERDRVRQLFKDKYFVYNQSIPLQRSRNWFDTIQGMYGVNPSPTQVQQPGRTQPNPEVSVIQVPGDSGGVQAAPSSGGVPSIPAQTKGPSIAFLPSNNFDSYAGLSAKMLYNIVEA